MKGSISRRNTTRPRRLYEWNVQSEDWWQDYEYAVYTEAEDIKQSIQGRLNEYKGAVRGIKLGEINVIDFGMPDISYTQYSFEAATVKMGLFVPDAAMEYIADEAEVSDDDFESAIEEYFSDYFYMWSDGLEYADGEVMVDGGFRFNLVFRLGDTGFTVENWSEYNEADMYESKRHRTHNTHGLRRIPKVHRRTRR